MYVYTSFPCGIPHQQIARDLVSFPLWFLLSWDEAPSFLKWGWSVGTGRPQECAEWPATWFFKEILVFVLLSFEIIIIVLVLLLHAVCLSSRFQRAYCKQIQVPRPCRCFSAKPCCFFLFWSILKPPSKHLLKGNQLVVAAAVRRSRGRSRRCARAPTRTGSSALAAWPSQMPWRRWVDFHGIFWESGKFLPVF